MKAFRNLVLLFLLTLGCLADGCTRSLELYRYDNPEIRRWQAETTRKFKPQEPRWSELTQLIGERVIMIAPDTPREYTRSELIDFGRGAALTSDGYFLTAEHVVDGPFTWRRYRGYDQLEFGRVYTAQERSALISEEILPGRLVWSDPDLDLAIVKFEVSRQPHFDRLKATVRAGEIVCSADEKGTGVLGNGKRLASMVGNGSFDTAGEVIQSAPLKKAIGGTRTSLSLVARGGMSGAPVVTLDGELCGIISRAERKPFGRVRTVAMMAAPDQIRSIIEADRTRSR